MHPLSVAQLNVRPPTSFTVDARLAVHTPNQSGQVALHWQHFPARDVLSFYSPLGQTLGVLTSDVQGAQWVDTDQHVQQGESVAALTQQWLGWSLPLQDLSFWVVGAPATGKTYVVAHQGDTLQLTQSGWTVTYQRWGEVNGQALPDKLMFSGAGITGHWVVSHWGDAHD